MEEEEVTMSSSLRSMIARRLKQEAPCLEKVLKRLFSFPGCHLWHPTKGVK